MTLLIKQIINLIRLLHSENGQNQVAAGLAFGVFLGFAPFLSIQTLFVLLIVFLFRVQLGAVFISAFFFKFVAFLTDPIADPIGRILLEHVSLRPIWTYMYNVPILPMTQFNNSIVMGSFWISLVLCPLLFFIFKKLVAKYQATVVVRFQNSKIWKAFKATKAYDLYTKYNDLYGGA